MLYAPTFRDYLAGGDHASVMPDLFDLEVASERLGEDYVILVRGHAFNARTDRRISRIPRCLEVTDYPEVSDLYLASDVAVVDYSSLRFDFGVTGKPMIFHVPDLQRYQDSRGWFFDFEPMFQAIGDVTPTHGEHAKKAMASQRQKTGATS